jgi:RNA polymerase sigma-70 factor (ECF subfamily)
MAGEDKNIKSINSKNEDMELIAKALKGEQKAFERLMSKYQQMIHNLIFRMIYKKEDVEDLTQEAFIKAFNSLEKFDKQFSFATWLCKIATNNCIDYLRKKKLSTFSIDKEIESDEDNMQFEIPDSNFIPDKNILDSERKKILQNAIQNLPEKYRQVIILRHQEEMDYEEIAEKLDLPLGTIKAHIFRAREMLYKSLKDKFGSF